MSRSIRPYLEYQADRVEAVANLPDHELVEGQRSYILDPNDPFNAGIRA